MRGRAPTPELLAYLMAQHEHGKPLRELSRENEIPRSVLTRWWKRYRQEGLGGLKRGSWQDAPQTRPEDASILAARIREVRERAGYKTPGELWNAIKRRGGNITRQYIYQLEHGKSTASAKKIAMIVDACGMTMEDFLGTDLIIGPRGDTNIQERKLVTMLTKIRASNPTLARVLESAVISAYNEVLKTTKKN